MSAGPRIPLEQACALAKELGARWKLPHLSRLGPIWVVGSVRRERPTVGDLEFLAPHEPKENDTLYDAIASTLCMPGEAASIFGAPPDHIGKPVEGFKRGFLAASFEISMQDQVVPVQVFRYTPANRGWQLLMRTGPSEFGIAFLGKWKEAFGIPKGSETAKASVDGHLVDKYGNVVPVDSEEDCFAKAGMRYVPPQQREAWRKS